MIARTPLGLAGLRGWVWWSRGLIDHIGFVGCMIPLVLQKACWWISGGHTLTRSNQIERPPPEKEKKKEKTNPVAS